MRIRNTILMAGAALAAAAAAAALASETLTYSYDSRGRLIRVDHSGSVNNNVVANYSYDKADNRTLKNVSGAP
jgi:coenzyme F420-reducing hydrogenase delta subunit